MDVDIEVELSTDIATLDCSDIRIISEDNKPTIAIINGLEFTVR